ncbi:unnamed protein product [Trifolium pratense]|uniref:Uncharacterized protein n=1 Tax=Trifolium pratense TaxID=57577 RepID=A0ACB0KKS5_TRIPR|nr:unnamed protein product [Trifolium pratense]
MAARKLRHYFLAHSIVVQTDQPIKQLLARPDMTGRMLKWSLELSEFEIFFESRKALKAQGFDEYMNLVLDDAEEVNVKKKSKKTLGRILLKGDNITLMMNT